MVYCNSEAFYMHSEQVISKAFISNSLSERFKTDVDVLGDPDFHPEYPFPSAVAFQIDAIPLPNCLPRTLLR